ncbi:hypothetical protein BY996DRAFT_2305253 [Phakopsora pachyrhizi]|nr:hypothetical protein BY996DRAFT_2305253 [Phakopsora pachyrhizi]
MNELQSTFISVNKSDSFHYPYYFYCYLRSITPNVHLSFCITLMVLIFFFSKAIIFCFGKTKSFLYLLFSNFKSNNVVESDISTIKLTKELTGGNDLNQTEVVDSSHIDAYQSYIDSNPLAIASHELRTPLGSVIGYLELLSQTTKLDLQQVRLCSVLFF